MGSIYTNDTTKGGDASNSPRPSPPIRVAVIGAGPSGITAAKNVIESGLGDHLVVFETSGEVGGNWVYREEVQHSSVYENTHTISSRYLSEYEDYPFPPEAPDYLPREVLCQYFLDYATKFHVVDKIRFHTQVIHAEQQNQQQQWKLTSRNLQTNETQIEVFDYLMVANGHHWDPRMPTIPGEETFCGQIMHSHSYKNNRPFAGHKILVIGGGNSACDVAVECSRVATTTHISMRHGHWFVPKFIFGIPADLFNFRTLWIPVPKFIRNFVQKLIVWMIQGTHKRLGLQIPKYDLFEGHVTLNSELPHALLHGSIQPQTAIDRIEGSTVHFTNGRYH